MTLPCGPVSLAVWTGCTYGKAQVVLAGSAARTYRARLLAGRIAGQRDEIFERVLRVEMRRVANGRVGEVGGGRLGQNGCGGEVQGRGRVGAAGDACRDGRERRSGGVCPCPGWGGVGWWAQEPPIRVTAPQAGAEQCEKVGEGAPIRQGWHAGAPSRALTAVHRDHRPVVLRKAGETGRVLGRRAVKGRLVHLGLLHRRRDTCVGAGAGVRACPAPPGIGARVGARPPRTRSSH